MIYRLPELSDKEILMDYVSEHRTNGENSISASVGMLAGELSELLRNRLGDIGYGVRSSERDKGYATEMLRYALSVCKQKGMDRVILGCI